MTDFLTWDEVKNQLGKDCTIILGNGFSRSYCNSAFNQFEILQHMPSLQNIANITDIEKCIEETQAKVSNDLPDKTVPKTIIDRWIKSMLHKEFVDTLYSMMPKSLNDIADFTDDKLAKYRDFFNCFDRVFTLNYDPLLYWMLMRFMNFGDREYVDYTMLKNELSLYDKNSKNYEKIQNKFNDIDSKCRKSVRTEMYPVYLQGKDYYKMSLLCKGELLLEKNINEAQKMFLIKWEKLSNELYNALENNKNSNEIFKEESLELDKVAESTLNKKLDSVEKNI
ncbi:hypothetical protein J6O48_10380, partial [bacterium]|nr:hypothetical protein [bacterium]